jgi:hypothetical protein
MELEVRFTTVFLLACLLAPTDVAPSPSSADSWSRRGGSPATGVQSKNLELYHRDPAHIWNRVHRLFHVRRAAAGQEFGDDELDPLLWASTTYLLTGPSHERAVALLDEFLRAKAERLVSDPLKRAVFQHDLWKVFDWVASSNHQHAAARRALATRLAKVMRRVALTRDQIAKLPDTYAAATSARTFPAHHDPIQGDRSFLPPNLFDTDGPWVSLSNDAAPIAELHAELRSQSAFSAFMRLPGGRTETLRYLRTLWAIAEPYVEEQPFPSELERRATLNPALPQLPRGTQLALVRQMLLIDDSGTVVPSSITESVQIRVVGAASAGTNRVGSPLLHQRFFEFQMTRRRLFASLAGGLRAVERDEHSFVTFSSHGNDPFEQGHDRLTRLTLEGCASCHGAQVNGSLPSVLSATRLLRPHRFLNQRDPRSELTLAAFRKMRRYEWGLLHAYWHADTPGG